MTDAMTLSPTDYPEVTALIATLHENVQRIEELTGGEVDSVTDREGRIFLLRRAQEKLRLSEAAKQAAILNALPTHIALLNAQGVIVAVNTAWREFGLANGLEGGDGVGQDYLAVCETPHEEADDIPRQAANGIRAVMNGTSTSFTLEYCCHAPTQERWFVMTVMPMAGELPNGVLVMHENITERNEARRRLQHLAYYDSVTGLPNRVLFYESLSRTLTQAQANDWTIGVLFIDLDHFKNVNDTLGHGIGDELLYQFSLRLKQCVRMRDIVGRLGGDEFALILIGLKAAQNAALVAKKIQGVLEAPFDIHGNEVRLSASIGITSYPADASDPETLIKYADTAMYRAKQAGRNTFLFFAAQMNLDILARIDLENALRKAIDNDEFVLVYQPKVQLDSGRIVGLEALLRWRRPGHGLVSPKGFIPVLEETGLISRVGSWVIATACMQIGKWARSAVGPIQVSVNVAGCQFIEGDLGSEVIRAIQESDIDPSLLELELTESSLMANNGRTIASMQLLKQHGVQISIDDFGTGYSNLAYLDQFPIDKLKIDMAFVRKITVNPDDAAIVLAIIRMAHSLKLGAIAEGVETETQVAYLRQHGCDQIQGYYFSPPVPVEEVEKMLLEGKCLAASQFAAGLVSV